MGQRAKIVGMINGQKVVVRHYLNLQKFPNFRAYYIYVLLDPTTNEVRYVGITSSIAERYIKHLDDRFKPTPKGQWTKSLSEQGLVPNLVILEKLDTYKRYAQRREKQLIQEYLAQGCKLFNIDQ